MLDSSLDPSVFDDILNHIYSAIETNQTNICTTLMREYIKKWPNWEFKDFKKSGSTPLICACQNGSLSVAEFLVINLGFPVSDCGTVRYNLTISE